MLTDREKEQARRIAAVNDSTVNVTPRPSSLGSWASLGNLLREESERYSLTPTVHAFSLPAADALTGGGGATDDEDSEYLPAGGPRFGRLPVEHDSTGDPLRPWRQDQESGTAATAAADYLANAYRQATGEAPPARPVVWRDRLTLGRRATATADLPLGVTDAEGSPVVVRDFPLPLDTPRGVRPAVTPTLYPARLPAAPRASKVTATAATGTWALAAGEYPRRISEAGAGYTATLNADGRVPHNGSGVPLGQRARDRAIAAYPELADAIEAIPVPERTGDSAADKRAGAAYRQAIRRLTGDA